MATKLRVRDELGYQNCRLIHFKKHKYMMIYEVTGGKVYVHGVFHASRDIKTKITKLK